MLAVGTIFAGCNDVLVEGPIRGHAVDKESRQPLAGAVVRLSHAPILPSLLARAHDLSPWSATHTDARSVLISS
jgi:hypothetical protein